LHDAARQKATASIAGPPVTRIRPVTDGEQLGLKIELGGEANPKERREQPLQVWGSAMIGLPKRTALLKTCWCSLTSEQQNYTDTFCLCQLVFWGLGLPGIPNMTKIRTRGTLIKLVFADFLPVNP